MNRNGSEIYMDKKFKWNMFITSFMPLWISMIISDIWTIVESGIKIWRDEESIYFNILNICKENLVCIVAILIIGILMLTSIISINSFLNDKKKNNQPPRIKIKKAVRANKLSSEFLLAYILPMIAFDFAELKSVILFVVYFGMLAFLCIRDSNVYTNIWLEIKGYRMYLCDLQTNVMGRAHTYEDCLVISKNDLTVKIENNMEYWDFDNYIYIDLR